MCFYTAVKYFECFFFVSCTKHADPPNRSRLVRENRVAAHPSQGTSNASKDGVDFKDVGTTKPQITKLKVKDLKTDFN